MAVTLGLRMEEMIFNLADTHLFFNDLEVRILREQLYPIIKTLRWFLYMQITSRKLKERENSKVPVKGIYCIYKYKQKLKYVNELYLSTGAHLEQNCLGREAGLLCCPIPYTPIHCSSSFQCLNHNPFSTFGIIIGFSRLLIRTLFRLIAGLSSQVLFMVLTWVIKFCRSPET